VLSNPAPDDTGEPLFVVARELSESGLLLISEENLLIDATLELSFSIPFGTDEDEVEHVVTGKVVEQSPWLGYRVEFLAPPAVLLQHIRALKPPAGC
jgi:hypothetical protein